jgi:hypothetical protein
LKHALSRLKFLAVLSTIPLRYRGQELEFHALLIPGVDGGKLSVSRPNLFRSPTPQKKKKDRKNEREKKERNY